MGALIATFLKHPPRPAQHSSLENPDQGSDGSPPDAFLRRLSARDTPAAFLHGISMTPTLISSGYLSDTLREEVDTWDRVLAHLHDEALGEELRVVVDQVANYSALLEATRRIDVMKRHPARFVAPRNVIWLCRRVEWRKTRAF